MEAWELPLVLFTVLGQWGIGIALMITIAESVAPSIVDSANRQNIRFGGMMVLPLIALGLLFSVFHLGTPFAAYKALFNLGTSMLSLEILAFIIVSALALVYSYMWWKNPDSGLRRTIGIVLSVVGIIAIVISSKVYTMPTRLGWDSWETIAAFLLTAVLLGATTVAALVVGNKATDVMKANKVLAVIILLAVVGIVVTLAGISSMYGQSAEQSAVVIGTFANGMFFVRLLLSLMIPVIMAAYILSNKATNNLVTLGLGGIVVGELLGRVLFYSSTMSQYPWF